MKRGLFIYSGQMHQQLFWDRFRLFDQLLFFLDSTRQSYNTCHLFINICFDNVKNIPKFIWFSMHDMKCSPICVIDFPMRATKNAKFPYRIAYDMCVCMSLMCDDCILPYCCTAHMLLSVKILTMGRNISIVHVFSFPFSLT